MPRSRRRSRVASQAEFLSRRFDDPAVRVMAGRALEIIFPPHLVGIGDCHQLFHLVMTSQARLNLGDVHWSRQPLRDSQLEILTRLLTDRGVRNVAVNTDQARLFMDRRVPLRVQGTVMATQAHLFCRLGCEGPLGVVAGRALEPRFTTDPVGSGQFVQSMGALVAADAYQIDARLLQKPQGLPVRVMTVAADHLAFEDGVV